MTCRINFGKSMPSHKKHRIKAREVRIGTRTIMTEGLETSVFGDLYHRSMQVSWPVFFICCATFFLTINCFFAFLLAMGDHPVANIRPDHPEDLFFFSIETLATVGYGDMHPQTTYGHLLATCEIFIGMSFITVMTGLVFNRFSRPRARILFANNPTIGPNNGVQTLMLRIANERHNLISEARAELWFAKIEHSAEGIQMRRFYQLHLERGQNPLFALSWTLFHPIDEKSPLWGLNSKHLKQADAMFILTFHGLDDQSGHILNARKSYSSQNVLWGHIYKDILSTDPDGLAHINYNLFHDTIAVSDHHDLHSH
jgi:inward rectifier potassium channel